MSDGWDGWDGVILYCCDTRAMLILIPAQGYNRTMITVPLQSLPFKYSSYQYSQYGQVRRNINQTIPRIGSEQYPMSTKVFSYTGCFPGQIYLQTISKGKTWFSDFWHSYKCKNLQLLCRKLYKSQEGYFVEAGAVNGVLDSNSLVWN